MDRLFSLLTDLSVDPFKQEAFARDPAAFVEAAGLDPAERAVLARWGNGGDDAAIANGPWARAAFIGDPGDNPVDDPDPPNRRPRPALS